MQIPDGVSPLRFMLDVAKGDEHVLFRNLDEARRHPDVALVMEADTGGQILFTCPVSRIHCAEATLEQLLHDLANISWGDGGLDPGNGYYDEEGMYYELLPVGSGVSGGMGGGCVVDGVWIHKELEDIGLRSQIEAVVAGRQPRLTSGKPK